MPLLSPLPWEVGRSSGDVRPVWAFLDQTPVCPSFAGPSACPHTCSGPGASCVLPRAPPRCPSASSTLRPLPPWSPVPCPRPCQGTVLPRHGLQSGTEDVCPADQKQHGLSSSPPSPSLFPATFPVLFLQMPCFCSLQTILGLLSSVRRSGSLRRLPLCLFRAGARAWRAARGHQTQGRTRSRSPQRLRLSVAGGRVLDRSVGRRSLCCPPRLLFRPHGPETRVGARALGWAAAPLWSPARTA